MDLFEAEQRIYDRAVKHMKAVDAGEAYDFEEFRALTKGYHAILRQLRRITKLYDRTTDNLHESNLDLADKVHYDALTGIYSRRFMEEGLERNIRSLSRSGGVMAVMMMDIDFFKKYNDTYGHTAGDECLRTVAKAIAGCIARADDFVARYGGEEFVAVLPNTDEKGVALIAEKVLQAIRGLGIPHVKNEAAGCVTISIGATTVRPRHGHQAVDYIKRADAALYVSKHEGRDRYTYIRFEEDS